MMLQERLFLVELGERKKMNIVFFGDRLKDLGGFEENDLHRSIKKSIKQKILELKESGNEITLLTDLNVGISQWAAEAAISLGIPYEVYIPHDNRDKVWPKPTKDLYEKYLQYAESTTQTSEGEFNVAKLGKCEETMVDKADEIFGYFNRSPYIERYIEKQDKCLIDLRKTLDQSENEDDTDDIPF